MNRISIKLRVTLWYTLVMTVMSAIILVAMFSVSQNMLTRDITTRLVKTVTDSSRRFVRPNGQIPPMPDFMYYEQGVHMELYDESKTPIAGMIPFDRENIDSFQDKKLRPLTLDGKRYYVYDHEIRTMHHESLWIRGVISATDESYAMRSIMKTNLILAAALIIIAAFGGYLILKRALAPVDKISRTARQISESNDLSGRISIGSGKDEIHRLANTFDTMLDRIEKTLKREKQFTSDASHELRTPVAVMISECEYMLDCAKSLDECKESAASVKRQAEKMSKLIADLLSLSRMDHGTQKTNFETLDISELLTFVCEEQIEIQDDSIRLIQDITPNVTADADRFLIARLFINLIANAYQYSSSGGTIQVSLKEKGNDLTVSVSDNGMGIPPEHLEKIWERFYQVDPARSGKDSGSMGLGLAMVKQIADCHKGTVSAESALNKGTTFAFTMPKKA